MAGAPWLAVEQVLQSELGAEVNEVFASFERTLIAAASITRARGDPEFRGPGLLR